MAFKTVAGSTTSFLGADLWLVHVMARTAKYTRCLDTKHDYLTGDMEGITSLFPYENKVSGPGTLTLT